MAGFVFAGDFFKIGVIFSIIIDKNKIMEEQNKKSSKVGLGIMIVLVLAIVALGIVALNKKPTGDNNTIVPPITDTTATTTTENTGSTGKKTVYKNGTYTAEGVYGSPAGDEKISITLTLVNDVVTDASAINEAQSPESREYQNKFISGFKQYVVGKNIDEISLTRVSGSSLTPEGFNQALSKIKAEAKA